MKRVCGYTLFWFAAGMTVMLFMRASLLSICMIIFCLVLGYNLFNTE
ncbi:MAG TPA: hypothetical protein IAB53_03250 [Candidatus Scybalocola faecipullorum]|nr:hypothetical protein [Candidatus Scybalocola faecipullorum]